MARGNDVDAGRLEPVQQAEEALAGNREGPSHPGPSEGIGDHSADRHWAARDLLGDLNHAGRFHVARFLEVLRHVGGLRALGRWLGLGTLVVDLPRLGGCLEIRAELLTRRQLVSGWRRGVELRRLHVGRRLLGLGRERLVDHLGLLGHGRLTAARCRAWTAAG